MKSIQSQLTVGLVVITIVVSVIIGGFLVAWLRRAMLEEFDRSLVVNAHALQSLVTQRDDGSLDVDVDLRSLSDFTGRSATDYFVFTDDSGKRIAGSNPASIAMSARPGAAFWETQLPNGVPARAIKTAFTPVRQDEDEEKPRKRTVSHPAMTVNLIVARDRRPLDSILWRISLSITAAAGTFLCVAILATVFVVQKAFASLRVLAAEVAAVDVTQVGSPFDVRSRPTELIPIVQRLNEMLQRVAAALLRERHFNAAVSHELRTPIAELRSGAEIALREPDDLVLAQRAVVQSQEIAIQMQAVVGTLLAIASTERAAEPTPLTRLRIATILDPCIKNRSDKLRARGIEVDNSVSEDAAVYADKSLLLSILDNLLGNAAQYARANTSLLVTASRQGDETILSFENDHDQLSREDVEQVFDPFWRKDAARSNGQHVGLGLSLVRSYCNAMGASVTANLTDDNRFRVSLHLRTAGTEADAACRREMEPAEIGGLQ